MKKKTLLLTIFIYVILSSNAQSNIINNPTIKIAAGVSHSLALKEDGTVWACGRNERGQLGDGTNVNQTNPVQVLNLTNVKNLAAGSYHNFAIKEDGTVWSWGYNQYGELGDGTTTLRSTPVQISNLTNVNILAAGDHHSLCLKKDGTVWAWGSNYYGQLGDGTTTQKSTPVQVTNLTNVKNLAAGYFHSLALKEDGTVWAWGNNNNGQLGDGTSSHKSTPVQVSNLSTVKTLAAGSSHSLALKEDGTVWAWGWNHFGQLGDGTNTQKITPVQVSNLTNVKKLAVLYSHSLALKEDWTVWAWGWNNDGQVGDGTTIRKSTPVQVSNLINVKALAAGYSHSLALKEEGTIWAWGSNEYGQLGHNYPTYLPEKCISELQFSSKIYVTDKNSVIHIPVINNTIDKNVSISYSTKNGSALSGIDYIESSGTLTFNENDKMKTFSVAILNNNLATEDKTLFISLSAPSDIFLNDGALSIITICTDFDQPTITIADQKTLEDMPIVSIPLHVSSTESAGCKYDLCFSSSNVTLISSEDISYTCFSDSFYISLTPIQNAFGNGVITVTVDEGGNFITSTSFMLTVLSVNDAPFVKNSIPDQTTLEDYAYNFSFYTATFGDVDLGDVVQFSASLDNGNPLPSWLTFHSSTRNFSGTPSNSDIGTITISVTAEDTAGAFISEKFELAVWNTDDAPEVCNSIPDQIAIEDSFYRSTFNSNTFCDIDIGDSFYYKAKLSNGNPLPSWLTFNNPIRTFSGIPINDDVGAYTIIVTAEDTSALTATDCFLLTVRGTNDAPTVANRILDQKIVGNSTYDFTFHSNTFDDVDGDTLIYKAILSNGELLPSWLTFHSLIRNFKGIPSNDDSGTYTIEVIAEDYAGLTACDRFDLIVLNTNDAPMITPNIPDQTIPEGTAFTKIVFDNHILDEYYENSEISWASKGQSDLTVTISSRIATIESPNEDWHGTETIIFTATNPDGLTSKDIVVFTVLSVNDSPVARNVEFSIIENQLFTGQLNAYAYDIDSPITSFSIVSNPDKGTVNISNTGAFTYTPDLNQYGEDSFAYQAYDNESSFSNTAIVSIFITPINAPPFAYGKDITIDEDKYIYITLVATDPDNDIITYHLVTHPTHGTITLTDDTVLYTPHSDVNGPDSFKYKANDGLADSNTAKIMITVYPVYDSPKAINQHVTITEDMPVNITLTGFSPDDKSLSFQIIDQPSHGMLSQSSSNLTYTPDFHFFGEDHFTFVANDSISDSNPATVSITVKRRETYMLKLLGTAYGTVNINSTSVLLPWESQFQADQEVCFEAIPDTDWKFINWTGDLQSSENPVCVLLNKGKTITANMAIKTFELSIQGNEAIIINNKQHNLPFTQIFEIHTPIILESASDRFNCWEGEIQTFQNPFEFTIQSNMALTANFYPVPDWQTEIHVDRWLDNPDVMQHNSVFIGTASQAYSQKSAAIADNHSCDIIVLNNQTSVTMNKDIQQNIHDEYLWVISVNPHGNVGALYLEETATLSWDASTLSPKGQYVLKNNTDEIVISDMRLITEYDVSDTSYTSFKIIWESHETFDFHLKQGWNLISLPLTPSTPALDNLFPDYEAAYEFKNGGYAIVTTIIPGKGYWLKIPSQKVYSISGQPFQSYAINLSEGWHLIGGSYEEMTPNLDMSIKVIFRYVDGRYEQAFSLISGWGYWIKIK